MRQVPVLLISGFLGSGKTTFVNWIIKHKGQKKVSIILNEFGDVQLESQFIEDDDAFVAELSGGCMCCIAKSDVPHVIHLILDKYPDTDYVVIEASGLSEPDPIKTTLTSPGLSDRIYLDKNICMVDTVHFLENRTSHAIVMAQVADADKIILTKTNHDTSQKETIVKDLSVNMPDVPIIEITERSTIESFLDAPVKKVQNTQQVQNHKSVKHQRSAHDHDHERYDEYMFKTEKALNFEKFVTVLNHLPSTIVRAKGFVRIVAENGQDQKLLVQYVQGTHEFTTEAWDKDQAPQTAIVFLGKEFDKQELNTRLIACQQ